MSAFSPRGEEPHHDDFSTFLFLCHREKLTRIRIPSGQDLLDVTAFKIVRRFSKCVLQVSLTAAKEHLGNAIRFQGPFTIFFTARGAWSRVYDA